jgi:Zn-dependent protease
VLGSDTSVTMGRVMGVPVRVGPGAALLAGALAVLLGSRWAITQGGVAYLWSGLAAVGFLGSILVHELGHALVARRHGVAVTEIQLVLFGGLARLERQAPSPRAEMAIAVAGPLASLGLAAAGIGGVLVLRGQGFDSGVLGALGWLAVINGLLGGFNLLPGLPLDGGRVLTGWLWSRRGDRPSAVRSAAAVGRFLGIALIAIGAAEILLLQSFTGLWTAMVGNILIGSARVEAGQARLTTSVRGHTVAEAMDARPPLVELGTRAVVARALLPNPARQRWAVAVDEDGVARALVDLVALDRLAESRPDEPVDGAAVPVDERRAAFAGEQLESLLARVAGLPVIVIDEGWQPVGILADVRVQSAGPGPLPA